MSQVLLVRPVYWSALWPRGISLKGLGRDGGPCCPPRTDESDDAPQTALLYQDQGSPKATDRKSLRQCAENTSRPLLMSSSSSAPNDILTAHDTTLHILIVSCHATVVAVFDDISGCFLEYTHQRARTRTPRWSSLRSMTVNLMSHLFTQKERTFAAGAEGLLGSGVCQIAIEGRDDSAGSGGGSRKRTLDRAGSATERKLGRDPGAWAAPGARSARAGQPASWTLATSASASVKGAVVNEADTEKAEVWPRTGPPPSSNTPGEAEGLPVAGAANARSALEMVIRSRDLTVVATTAKGYWWGNPTTITADLTSVNG
ncbi:hypothetical protein QBC39DRAFT_334212 [Podospora conica]|nr:hypothetical protein QBC39DRAFT_334212 [Schizothecium conicum]